MAEEVDWNNDAWRDQVRENSARHVFVYKTFGSVGSGEVSFEDPVDFGLWFSEMPMVSYGYALDMVTDPAQELLPGDYPVAMGGVEAWSQDHRGLYIGATCFAFVMGSLFTYTTYQYSLEHHFTFSGIGVKDVGSTDFEADHA